MKRTKKVSRSQYYLHRMIKLGMQMFGFGNNRKSILIIEKKKKPKMVLKVEKRDDTKGKKDE